jgi:regulator of protease activity HflC (stomatin/prohibitin superfamily)
MLDKFLDFFLQFIHFFQFTYVVHSFERGVVLRFGKFHRLAEPGLVFAFPFFIEQVLTVYSVDEPIHIGPQSLTTSDGKRVVVCAVFVIAIENVAKFLLDLEGGKAAVLMFAQGALAEFVENKTWRELLTPDPEEAEEDHAQSPAPRTLAKQLAACLRRKVLRKYGVGVVSAQITDLTEARSIRLMGVAEGLGHVL